MVDLEDAKRYFWYIFGILGTLFFWAGMWDGLGSLGFLKNPFISMAIGLILLSLSGVIFKDANPLWEVEKPVKAEAKKVHHHPLKHEFHFKYEDHLKKKELTIHAGKLKRVEKEFLVFLDKGKEVFVPLHRVTEILHKGKTHWKA
ncbi:hypothetical protein A3H04_00625 [Candidatus Giovannonibacteria bacterium RIFCSPLOWO2_12_FULL_43_11c]|nr:MAG: hypothetical protein A3H04_00625 [Candidatus Giovannonibacteria bacterium RIFCSPLOWO2_12_FULL_43_11c]